MCETANNGGFAPLMKGCCSDKTKETVLLLFLEVIELATKKKRIPRYSTVDINGHNYYRTTITDAENNRISLYGKTREEQSITGR